MSDTITSNTSIVQSETIATSSLTQTETIEQQQLNTNTIIPNTPAIKRNSIGSKMGSLFILFISFIFVLLSITIAFDADITTYTNIHTENNIYIYFKMIPGLVSLLKYISHMCQLYLKMRHRTSGIVSYKLSSFGRMAIVTTAFLLFLASLVDFIRIGFLELPSLVLFGDIEEEDEQQCSIEVEQYNNNTAERDSMNGTHPVKTEITNEDPTSHQKISPASTSAITATTTSLYTNKNLLIPYDVYNQEDLVSDTRLLEVLHVFICTTRVCCHLWSPQQDIKNYQKVRHIALTSALISIFKRLCFKSILSVTMDELR